MSRSALQGLADGSRTGKREQTVMTPPEILDPLREVWGKIAMDPCAPPQDAGSLVDADHEIRPPDDGLRYSWIDRTYCNPEYARMKSKPGERGWLNPATEDGARIAWLIPMRSHRVWWRRWAASCDVVIALDPIAFMDYPSKFPAPLVLGYRGADADAIVAAFAHIGSPCTFVSPDKEHHAA